MGGYRDDLQALADRHRALCVEVGERRAQITSALWRRLPPDLQQEVEQAEVVHGRASLALDGPSERQRARALHEALAAVEGYNRALAEALDEAPRIERRMRRVPASVRAPKPPSRSLVTPLEREVCDDLLWEVRVALRRFDADVAVEHVSGRLLRASHFRARFNAWGAPFVWQGTALSAEPVLLQTMTTSVAAATPSLHLVSERWTHRLLKRLGLARELELGHRETDERFMIYGSAASRRLLSKRVCQDLSQIAKSAAEYPVGQSWGVTLRVVNGVAEVRWPSDVDHQLMADAMRITTAIRRLPAQRRG